MTLAPPPVDQRHGLTVDEYALVVGALGRIPNDVELGMFGAMWSEHCAYKHSRPLLGRLPKDGRRVLVGPGENAGALDIEGQGVRSSPSCIAGSCLGSGTLRPSGRLPTGCVG